MPDSHASGGARYLAQLEEEKQHGLGACAVSNDAAESDRAHPSKKRYLACSTTILKPMLTQGCSQKACTSCQQACSSCQPANSLFSKPVRPITPSHAQGLHVTQPGLQQIHRKLSMSHYQRHAHLRLLLAPYGETSCIKQQQGHVRATIRRRQWMASCLPSLSPQSRANWCADRKDSHSPASSPSRAFNQANASSPCLSLIHI